MTKMIPARDFVGHARAWRAEPHGGLPQVIDRVAQAGPATHGFLRRQWFQAGLINVGGTARTMLVSDGNDVQIALPFIPMQPKRLKLAAVPGSYWPFRSFPAATRDPAAYAALLSGLARELNVLRIGPVYDGDASFEPLKAAAIDAGWAVLPRFIADSFLLDIDGQQAEGPWPRNSTLRKNRFHEKHLASHGALSWDFVADWTAAAFDDLASVERASWIAARTDGSDAKFTETGHGAFWRAVAKDPAISEMLHAAVLRVDGVPAAFSFDLDAGPVKYAIANSYDPRFAKHSPGKLLYYRNLTEGMDRGIRLVDWGAGDSGYKRVIGAEHGPAIRDWLLLRPGLPAAIGRLLRHGWARSGN